MERKTTATFQDELRLAAAAAFAAVQTGEEGAAPAVNLDYLLALLARRSAILQTHPKLELSSTGRREA